MAQSLEDLRHTIVVMAEWANLDFWVVYGTPFHLLGSILALRSRIKALASSTSTPS